MNFNKYIQNYWLTLEKDNPPPKYVSKVNDLEFSTLKKAIEP